ncbi:hypothetical protein SAMN05216371_7816 [Streptomyces sp. TLI_053]|uniref:hypothetical protein n=1 Tax=Streptomyces sp. TLI_053 TaxID=1855352 RepID=UPI00087991FE|nr:hypothetical protein [Streptomyces sp. TLI_053]SDT83004.1 hypothetical protein SAMN05216371_7816 [Streptomyces sp. TLI_053]
MRESRWVAQIVDGDLVRAASYCGLTPVLDVWLRSHTGFAGRAAAVLGAPVSAGALVGLLLHADRTVRYPGGVHSRTRAPVRARTGAREHHSQHAGPQRTGS